MANDVEEIPRSVNAPSSSALEHVVPRQRHRGRSVTRGDQRGALIRVVLADRKSLFREAVRVTLEREERLEVVSVAGDATETVAQVTRHRPQVVVLSDTVGRSRAIEAAQLIRECVPESRVLFLASGTDSAMLVSALRAGVSGYLTEDSVLAELIGATYAVARGETFLAQQMLAPLIEELTEGRERRQDALRMISRLTRR